MRVAGAVSKAFHAIWYGGHPLKWLLWPFGLAFGGAVAARRLLYRAGVLRRVAVAAPVIVVGNLTVGGTGKTPCVVWLAERLRERGFRPGIVCRGYGGRAASWPQSVTATSDPATVGDEAVLLALRTGCPVVAGPDRVAAARAVCAGGKVDLVLSDDGLQHYHLARTVEVAVVDGERGLGNGMCLPAGPLREPPSRLKEVDAVVVNGGAWGHAGVFRASMVATGARQTATGVTRALADFKGATVHAVAGIGHPERFFALLEEHGLVVEPHALPDHALLRPADLDFGDADLVMITEKDEVKCRAFAGENVWCVVAELRFAASEAERLVGTVLRQLDAVAA